MKQAKKNIADAKNLLEENRVESSINRSSYAIFHHQSWGLYRTIIVL
ncbi:MAG: HEPN domain-containing protein [Dysosmobacter sp.]|nr:HEPN domain-containing protein [Dysosmobacter sp.]